MERKVSWNADYLELRTRLIAKMEGGSSYGMLTKDFENIVRESIGPVTNGPVLRRNVRDLLREGGVLITLGKSHVKMTRLAAIREDKEAWRNAAIGAVAEVDADMKRHAGEHGASACQMSLEVFRKRFVVWEDCEAFRTIVKETFKAHNYTLQIHGGRVMVRRVLANTLPKIQEHNISSLLDILLKPTLTTKRRWCKGFTHALTSPEDEVIFLEGHVEDETGENTDRLIFLQSTVLLVDDRAYEMVKAAFKASNKTLIARPLV